MAHYKRGKCRYQGRLRQSSTSFYRKRLGLKPIIVPDGPSPWWLWQIWWDQNKRVFWPAHASMMGNWPRGHDIVHHTRPRRAREKRMLEAVRRGRIDPEEATWPLSKKPHVYFW